MEAVIKQSFMHTAQFICDCTMKIKLFSIDTITIQNIVQKYWVCMGRLRFVISFKLLFIHSLQFKRQGYFKRKQVCKKHCGRLVKGIRSVLGTQKLSFTPNNLFSYKFKITSTNVMFFCKLISIYLINRYYRCLM